MAAGKAALRFEPIDKPQVDLVKIIDSDGQGRVPVLMPLNDRKMRQSYSLRGDHVRHTVGKPCIGAASVAEGYEYVMSDVPPVAHSVRNRAGRSG